VTKDMLDLAKHIVNQKASTFEPEKFEDHYEEALTELINAKRNGKTVSAKPRPKGENVVDLMDALKRSIGQSEAPAPAKSHARPPPVKRKCCSRSAASGLPRRRRKLTKPRQLVPENGPELSLICYPCRAIGRGFCCHEPSE
jgi:DNA end-binding protein Ku